MQPAEPTIDQKRLAVQQEFERRNAGQMPSSAGVGAAATNSPQMGMPVEMMTNPPLPSGGASGTPSNGTMAAVKQQKGEAQKLTDAMIQRSKVLSQRGE